MIQILINCKLTLESPGCDVNYIDWLYPHLEILKWWRCRNWLIVHSPCSLQVVMAQILMDCTLTLEFPCCDDTDIDWLHSHLGVSSGDDTDIDGWHPHLGISRWWWYRYWSIALSPWTLHLVMILILIYCTLTLEFPRGDDTDIDWLHPHHGVSTWWWYSHWLIAPLPWSFHVVMIHLLIDCTLTLEFPRGDDTDIDWPDSPPCVLPHPTF